MTADRAHHDQERDGPVERRDEQHQPLRRFRRAPAAIVPALECGLDRVGDAEDVHLRAIEAASLTAVP